MPKILHPLLHQYDFGIESLMDRLQGLTDDEYLWEPAPGCWSVRPKDAAQSSGPLGTGEWVLDFGRPEPDPPPFTTIAWRITHLASGLASRADYTNGSHSHTPQDLDVPRSAAEAISTLTSSAALWRAAFTSANDEQIEQVGYSQLPWGLDPELPFIEIVWWVNKEVLQHGAEIAVLRDLYRATR